MYLCNYCVVVLVCSTIATVIAMQRMMMMYQCNNKYSITMVKYGTSLSLVFVVIDHIEEGRTLMKE